MCQSGFAEPGWAVEENMIKGFATSAGSAYEYLEILLDLALSDVFRKDSRAQRQVEGAVVTGILS
jgi:hypothetical protein